MGIRFIEETHEYWLDDKKLISTTTLMQKHGLAPSYDGVDLNVLNAAAKRGTLVHEEIENYFVKGEIGFTPELATFVEYVNENNIEVLANELLVHNDLVAGTIDLVLGNNTIADIKTTSTLHFDAVSWQLSIYAYLYNLTHDYKLVNGKVFHMANGHMFVKDIPLKPQWMVEKLFKLEENGELFKYELDYTQAKLDRIYEVENYIKETKLAQKRAELEAERLKTELLIAMQNQDVKKFETDTIIITRVDEYTKTTFDSKQLKLEQPNLYKEYLKEIPVEATVKITLKK